MIHQFILLLSSIYFVTHEPFSDSYNVTSEYIGVAELDHWVQYLHLLHMILGLLILVTRRFTFLRDRFSLQDIVLLLWLSLSYTCMRLLTSLCILLAVMIWDTDSYCIPHTFAESRKIKFTRLKAAFLSVSTLDYLMFSTIPVSIPRTILFSYFPAIHFLFTCLVYFFSGLSQRFGIVPGLRPELLLSSLPIAFLESWMFAKSDLNGIVHVSLLNSLFYAIIFYVTNVRDEVDVDPLRHSIYDNYFFLSALLIFMFQATLQFNIFWLLIQVIKVLLIVKATKKILPSPVDVSLYDTEIVDEVMLESLSYMSEVRKRDFRILQLFYFVIYSLLLAYWRLGYATSLRDKTE